jgi:hypothetical protein
MADLDLLELLSAEHVNLRTDVAGPAAVTAIEKHLTVERALLYPTVASDLEDGQAITDELRGIDNSLVAAVSKRGGTVSDNEIAAALEAHIGAQESHYSQLRQVVGAEKLRELADQVPLVMEEAPTRLHPHLPDQGPLREVTSELAAAVDQFRIDI